MKRDPEAGELDTATVKAQIEQLVVAIRTQLDEIDGALAGLGEHDER